MKKRAKEIEVVGFMCCSSVIVELDLWAMRFNRPTGMRVEPEW